MGDGGLIVVQPNTNFVGAALAKNEKVLALAKKIVKVFKEEVSVTAYYDQLGDCRSNG
jgi:hypothetical protein